MEQRMQLTVHVAELKLGVLRRLRGLFVVDSSDAGLACD